LQKYNKRCRQSQRKKASRDNWHMSVTVERRTTCVTKKLDYRYLSIILSAS